MPTTLGRTLNNTPKCTQPMADGCKAKGQVCYDGGCQRRNNTCNGGKGYLGQVPGNIGWGQCINFPRGSSVNPPSVSGRTYNPKMPNCFAKDSMTTLCWESPVGSNQIACKKGKEFDPRLYPLSYIVGATGKVALNDTSCRAIRGEWCRQFTSNNCAGTGVGPRGSAGPQTPVGSTDPDADCNNFWLGKGACVMGKSFLKGMQGIGGAAGQWSTSPVAQIMPVIMVGGTIFLLAILVKGK